MESTREHDSLVNSAASTHGFATVASATIFPYECVGTRPVCEEFQANSLSPSSGHEALVMLIALALLIQEVR